MSASIYRLRVPYSDTDQGGVVHHTAYLRYLEAARIEWLRERGVSYRTLEAEGRIALAVVDLKLRYVRAAKFDDLITVGTMATAVSRATMTFRSKIHREAELLTEAELVVACVDLTQGRARSLPEAMRALAQTAR